MNRTVPVTLYTNHLAGQSELRCPHCGDYNLHHDKVSVYERDTEDSAQGRRTTVSKNSVLVESSIEGNPSSRRNGLKIRFFCENCGNGLRYTLSIQQHKGMTYLHWEDCACLP